MEATQLASTIAVRVKGRILEEPCEAEVNKSWSLRQDDLRVHNVNSDKHVQNGLEHVPACLVREGKDWNQKALSRFLKWHVADEPPQHPTEGACELVRLIRTLAPARIGPGRSERFQEPPFHASHQF